MLKPFATSQLANNQNSLARGDRRKADQRSPDFEAKSQSTPGTATGCPKKGTFQLDLQNERPRKTVYALGVSQFGQLGLGNIAEKEFRMPIKIDLAVSLKKICLGAGHAIALSSGSKVYSWGLNLLGQLGLGNTEPSWSPTLIPALKDNCIVDVAAGAGHSFAVDKQGMAYSWGASADFQTGILVRPAGGAGQSTQQFLRTPCTVDGLNKKK